MSTGACYDYFFNPSTDNSVVFRVVSRGIRKIVTSPCGMRQQDYAIYGPGIQKLQERQSSVYDTKNTEYRIHCQVR